LESSPLESILRASGVVTTSNRKRRPLSLSKMTSWALREAGLRRNKTRLTGILALTTP